MRTCISRLAQCNAVCADYNIIQLWYSFFNSYCIYNTTGLIIRKLLHPENMLDVSNAFVFECHVGVFVLKSGILCVRVNYHFVSSDLC